MRIFGGIATALTLAWGIPAAAETANFDKDKIGATPEGWQAGVTGSGTPKWTVEAEADAPSKPNILKQSGEGTYPYCIKKDTSIDDGFVEVRFKPVAGKEDQAGGFIWRWKDGENYYISRANALEDNVTIYHTLKGSRSAFKSANVKVATNEWHSLRIDFKGTAFTVTFDGKKVIEAEDERIKGAGAVGVWTKADSITLFDDFTYGKE